MGRSTTTDSFPTAPKCAVTNDSLPFTANENASPEPFSLGRAVLAGFTFLGFGVGAAIWSWFVCPVAYVVSGGGERAVRSCRALISFGFRLFHHWIRLTRFIDYDWSALRDARPQTPTIVIANHPTLVDVTAVIAAWPELCYLAKASIFRNPIFYPLLRLAGHIGSEPGNVFSGLRTLEQALERVKMGDSVLIFPEGTRSPAGGLGPFHAGSFAIAARAQIPIQPLLIEVERPVLTKAMPWYRLPLQLTRIQIRPLATLHAQAGKAESTKRRALSAQSRQQYQQALGLNVNTQSTPRVSKQDQAS